MGNTLGAPPPPPPLPSQQRVQPRPYIINPCDKYIIKNTCNNDTNCYFMENKCISNNSLSTLNDIKASDITSFIYPSTNLSNTFVLACKNSNKNHRNIIIQNINIDINCVTNCTNILIPSNVQANYSVKDYLHTFDINNGELTTTPSVSQEHINIIKNNNNKITLIDIQGNKLIISVAIYNYTSQNTSTIDTDLINKINAQNLILNNKLQSLLSNY